MDALDDSHYPVWGKRIVIPFLWQLQGHVNLPANEDFYLLFPDSRLLQT